MTRYEAGVYLELLRLGQSGAGPIIRRTGFHRQFVYTALSALSERGLVTESMQKRVKVFHIPDPRELARRETERFRAVQTILPELISLQPMGTKQLNVEILTGSDEYFPALLSSIDSAERTDGIVRIIGGGRASDFYAMVGARYDEYLRYTQRKKIYKHLIASETSFKEYATRFANEKRATLKLMPIGLSAPSYTRMTKELVDIIVFGEDALIVRIWNKTIAKTYLEHFELLWKIAKPVLPTTPRSVPKKKKTRKVV